MSKRLGPPRNPIKGMRNVFTNLNAPMPLPRKVYVLTRNITRRAITLSGCCGHPGEPGC
ncbi:MAG: hypothetical protein L0332_16800 [Chloroflexi bacterium]|nr:hypothetical protein [Chloroflexota bacterium]MCI0575370.1 hypothetical protein [Chloroflexota bacterium]MCI0646382.1 hypothetical protein [Chloroflexota bacterium]MCI0728360.1 hypothetical protein [Chloroflexota bacterium]